MSCPTIGKRLVIFEDSPLFLGRLRRLFSETDGFEIVASSAKSGDARELLQQYQPDCLLIDMYLAEGVGLDVLRFVNTLQFRPVALMMTSEPSEELEQACRALGAVSLADKAHDFERIPELLGHAA